MVSQGPVDHRWAEVALTFTWFDWLPPSAVTQDAPHFPRRSEHRSFSYEVCWEEHLQEWDCKLLAMTGIESNQSFGARHVDMLTVSSKVSEVRSVRSLRATPGLMRSKADCNAASEMTEASLIRSCTETAAWSLLVYPQPKKRWIWMNTDEYGWICQTVAKFFAKPI